MYLTEKHICLVDDDQDENALFLNALKKVDAGTRLTYFSCCRDLLEFLEYSDNLPGVIVLDIYMPKEDGLACLAKIKASKKTSPIPVIIYSSTHSEKAKEDALGLGAADFFVKPIDIDDMQIMIKKALSVCSDISTRLKS